MCGRIAKGAVFTATGPVIAKYVLCFASNISAQSLPTALYFQIKMLNLRDKYLKTIFASQIKMLLNFVNFFTYVSIKISHKDTVLQRSGKNALITLSITLVMCFIEIVLGLALNISLHISLLHRPVGRAVSHLSLEQGVWDSNLGLVKSDIVANG